MSRLAECGFPDASSTGPAGALPIFTGDLTITTSNTVVDTREIHGCISVQAANVVIRNVRVIGNCFELISAHGGNLTVLDSEVRCIGPNTGVGGTSYTVRRTEITACENGLGVGTAGGVTLTDSWIHDLETCCQAHTDGAQIDQGSTNLSFVHNSIIVTPPGINGATSAIISWDEVDPQQQNVLIQDNLLGGGTYTLYCPRQGISDTRVIGNRFGTHEYGFSDSCTGSHVSAWSSNIVDATGMTLTAA